MITVSLCMIVKNEEAVLARCLDSLDGLMDEIIIVDTGSTDNTKAIARRYTNRVYDFEWCDDFAAARNFSFEKATMEYIYAPDADEVLDEENRRQFRLLKEAMLPEIEIVQMWYRTPEEHNTVQNFSRELRPKLFKRLRTFTWIDPVHETVRTDPVVFDSDIEILHLPPQNNSARDFSIYEKAIAREGSLSYRILSMYAKELLKQGSARDFAAAIPYFEKLLADTSEASCCPQAYLSETGDTANSHLPETEGTANAHMTETDSTTNSHMPEVVCTANPRIPEIDCVLARGYRLTGNEEHFLQFCLPIENKCAEICRELGFYYLDQADYDEALHWLEAAVNSDEIALDITVQGSEVMLAIAECCTRLAEMIPNESEELLKHAAQYCKQAEEWTLPDPKETGL